MCHLQYNISPLHVAAKWGKNNMVKVLLENSAQIDAKTRDGLTPLHCAARSGHEQVVSTLLENSAPISARTKVHFFVFNRHSVLYKSINFSWMNLENSELFFIAFLMLFLTTKL